MQFSSKLSQLHSKLESLYNSYCNDPLLTPPYCSHLEIIINRIDDLSNKESDVQNSIDVYFNYNVIAGFANLNESSDQKQQFENVLNDKGHFILSGMILQNLEQLVNSLCDNFDDMTEDEVSNQLNLISQELDGITADVNTFTHHVNNVSSCISRAISIMAGIAIYGRFISNRNLYSEVVDSVSDEMNKHTSLSASLSLTDEELDNLQETAKQKAKQITNYDNIISSAITALESIG